MTTLERLGACGVIPVVVLDDVDAAPSLGEALVAGGLPCAEITLRTSAAFGAIEMLAADHRLTVGAGTALDPGDVDRAVAAGAQFVVSPGLDVEVVRRCLDLDVTVLPGIATATEAMAALREGVTTVKLFPAEPLGGVRAVQALAAPLAALRFVPTGGIGPAELHAYAREPAVLAVGGTWIAPRHLLKACEFDQILGRAADAVATVAAARQADRAPA
jgi:2-dehydro-3-deoxyphosphogluconate aldolase / (4S)-4-hydroxy-2-oxoglutarate aldolase